MTVAAVENMAEEDQHTTSAGNEARAARPQRRVGGAWFEKRGKLAR